MKVELKFSKGNIILRAKDETYLSAKSILSDKERTDEQRYNMQAGNNAVHERKLVSSLGLALSELKSSLEKYHITDSMTNNKNSFYLFVEVSDRFYCCRGNDLQRVIEEYLYRRIVADWWQSNYPDMAEQYFVNASNALNSVIKLLSLDNPPLSDKVVKYEYSDDCGYKTIVLYRDEIINEIHAEMLKLSRFNPTNGTPSIELQTSEIKDEELIIRFINRHAGRICSRVNAYLVDFSNQEDDGSDNYIPVYKFRLMMPEGWDGRLIEQLAQEMHAYLVNASLFEWLKTINQEWSSIYGTQADSAYDNIKHAITVRKPGRIFKPLQPF